MVRLMAVAIIMAASPMAVFSCGFGVDLLEMFKSYSPQILRCSIIFYISVEAARMIEIIRAA